MSATAAAFDATDRNPATSAAAPSNTSGHQKWNGTAASLNPSPTRMRPNPASTGRSSPRRAIAGGHIGQVARAERAGEQRDAVEHDAAGARPVDDVLERRLAARPLPLQEPRQRVARQARHLDRDEDHQQVVRGGHQHHAERAAEQERVEVGGVVAVGDAGQLREEDGQERGDEDEAANEAGEGIGDEHPAEVRSGPPVLVDLVPGREERHREHRDGQRAEMDAVEERDEPDEEEHDDADADDQFGDELQEIVADAIAEATRSGPARGTSRLPDHIGDPGDGKWTGYPAGGGVGSSDVG